MFGKWDEGISLVSWTVTDTNICNNGQKNSWRTKAWWVRSRMLSILCFMVSFRCSKLLTSALELRASLLAQLVKNPPQDGRHGLDSWVGKISWRRERLPIPVFWSGEFHRLYSLWGCKESHVSEWLSLFTYTFFGTSSCLNRKGEDRDSRNLPQVCSPVVPGFHY